jgi:hypothetical protein
LRASVAFVLAVFAFEGLAVAVKDFRDARDAPSYAALGAELRETLPPGARVMGDNRLWPALRDQEHRSLLLLFYHTNPRISRGRSTDVAGAMERVAPEYVLLSPLSREILGQLTPEHSAEFDRYLSDRMDLVETIMNPAYGPHELYRRR